VCLDVLRSRKSKREEPLEDDATSTIADRKEGIDPEQEAVMADSVGLALLVVLETLGPAERLAFVLHDMFDLPFEEIAGIVGRTPNAARQLASRARRRVQGRRAAADADAARKREVVEAFLAAARRGDFEALLTLLDPEVVLHADAAAVRVGARESRGAATLAERAVKAGARAARPMLIDGEVGVVVAPRGRLRMVMRLTVVEGKIVEVEAVADPARLERMELAVLED
jgi:RNA polymerase sigma-70 factor (ECF subfamily)